MMRMFDRRYLLNPPRLEASLDGETIEGITAVVQNAAPYTFFGNRPVHIGEGATLTSGTLSGVVLKRASPIDIPTVGWRALSERAELGRHRRVHAFSRSRGARDPLARRASIAAPGRRRLHRRGG